MIIILISASLSAQSPQKFSYQAVVRNNSGVLVQSSNVAFRISLLQSTETGPVVYSETHLVSTNTNGLASLEIGGGSVLSGTFANINWSAGPYFLKTETDPAGGTDYSAIVGTSQLLGVPYALFAKTAETIAGGIIETDPKIGANTLGYSPKWNGSAFVTGAIYQNVTGNIGVGTTTPSNNLSVVGSADFSTSILSPLYKPLAGSGNSVIIASNDNPGGSGGSVTITAGLGAAAQSGVGGNITLQSGSLTNEGYSLPISASIVLTGNQTSLGGPGGNVNIQGGAGTYNREGGSVSLVAGSGNPAYANGSGGNVYVTAGNGTGSNLSGATIISAGSGGGGNGYIGFQLGTSEKMKINESGYVGIGISNPKSKLVVSGGDINVLDIGSGVIMKSPDGNCWRVMIDNIGSFVSTSIICP